MSTLWIAALLALFAWWFSTGAILFAVRVADARGVQARKVLALATLPVLALGVYGFQSTLQDTSVGAAYAAFFSALAIWGWIELAFLSGVVTGPNSHRCPDNAPEWERFIRAWGTIAYHEMLLVAVALAMTLYASSAANIVGLWTFLILFFARVSAKLNLFFGVPRVNTEFIPDALRHVPSHFRIARMNWLFPASITFLTFTVACFLRMAATEPVTGLAVGDMLLASLAALALLEHWLMVVPLPDARLWRWMLPAPKPTQETTRPEGHHGL